MDKNELARQLMDKIAKDLPEGVGAALILFDFSDMGEICYISNAQRQDMRKALHGLLKHWNEGDWNGSLN